MLVQSTRINSNATEGQAKSGQYNEAASSTQESGSSSVHQFLTFALNDEVYGIGILHIREILEYDKLTLVPLMPDFSIFRFAWQQ